ncbi:calmodulin-regulated spectrin-associated protein 1a [Boleophthalmus pectinirostris]|uniref:calmodulin-regulated spectrin-associated protein 1a n=1 Tax=Boleophthalmus pectinirostris TaxID=150288 RepID=UPI0024301305|nr:calmodulin-regulated spectrin-associated protein 1a [Boleophthalmus pectinirostris]
MNGEVNAGRGGTSRRSTGTDDAARGGIDHQVLPFETYDSARAKVAANLYWLFAKAFGPEDIPSDLQDPFYTDQYEQEHIKPLITHLLLSAELYCRVCDVPFQPTPLQSHKSVIQALSRKGLYILDDNEALVSEMDLTSTPIKMSFHIQLIDTLMTAYTEEMISIEKVVSTVKYFVESSDTMMLPLDLEDAMMFWINKVIMRGFTQKEPKNKHFLESPCHQKCPSKWYWKLLPVRYRKDQHSGHPHPYLPILDNLSSFVCVGTSLLAVVHFYCPELMRLEDICLKEVPSTAESLSNIQLLMDFSDEFLNKCVYLRPEDMLYSPPVLKINIMQIIAELFWIFEVVKPDFMEPQDLHENKYGQKNRSSSLSYEQDTRDVVWLRKRQRPLSQTVPYALHFPMKEDADSISLPHTMSKDSLSSNFISTAPRHMLGSGHPRKLSRCNLLNYIRFEDEEEEIEEEELVAIINPTTLSRYHHQSETEHRVFHSLSPSRTNNAHGSLGLDRYPISTERSVDKYFLEPLIPAVPKPAKEKSVLVNKEEECGESGLKGSLTVRISPPSGSCAPHRPTLLCESKSSSSAGISLRAVTQGYTDTTDQHSTKESDGFFLHFSEAPKDDSPLSSLEASNVSDTESFTEDNEDELQLDENIGYKRRYYIKEQSNFGEGESIKLGEDQKVSECDDKEDHSGCLSPCHSSGSWSSSSTGVKMTSFAEKKLLKLGLHGGLPSTNSTPRTTPDDSEASPCPPWQLKNTENTYSVDKETCKESRNITVNALLSPSSVVPVELLELHMQLEERRHAIECQKKKMETLSAQQRLKLGKAAFLNIVKKEQGRSDTLPLPIKQGSLELMAANQREVKLQTCKDDSCLEDLKIKTKLNEGAPLIRNNEVCQDSGQCLHSIEVLNEAISSIQQQIMQLSLQQDILIKHRSVLPPKFQTDVSTTPCVTAMTYHTKKSKAFVVNFQNNDDSNSASLRCPPKLSSSQHKASNQKQKTEKTCPVLDKKYEEEIREVLEKCKTEQDIVKNSSLSICNEQQCVKLKTGHLPIASQSPVNSRNPAVGQDQNSKSEIQTLDSEKEATVVDNSARIKAHLIEVDLSEITESTEQNSADVEIEQKNVLGFFFKDEERADEMAKRRAAFLIKQQRKAEEAKLRKQQQEVESELKRDEARRKAEEERIRKEEEKARREIIKQEYLRRKQEMLMEEQGLVKSLPRTRSRKSKPKSLHRGSSSLSKGATTTSDLGGSHHGSTRSLATEVESIVSLESHCAELVCSVESFPVLSRASSRNMERDWEIGSITSSITSTEYTGPKLFKEPCSKSNKPIIINAIAHCCLAGKVNETQKNGILEELDKCDSNHLIILFRDGGCQFRAIYAYSPDTEEITKVTGTGPRNISHKMIDKLYKYSSDRKQFSVIPAKSVSVSVDALTIHNHLWHIRRPGSARRK